MKKTLLFLFVMFCLSSAAVAADVTGTWTGSIVDGANGNGDSAVFVLKQEGEKVTGTAGQNPTRQVPIAGTVKGDEFILELESEGGIVTFALKITGDQMTGRIEMRSNGQVRRTASLTLKREAAKTQN